MAGYVEAPLAYDAVWALTFALQKSIDNLHKTGKSLEDFDYTDNVIKDVIMSYLNITSFEGVSVSGSIFYGLISCHIFVKTLGSTSRSNINKFGNDKKSE